MRAPTSFDRAAPTLAAWTAALAILALAALASVGLGISIEAFFRDPSATLGGHPLTGVISNLGALAWCAGAAICFFTAAILRRRGDGLATFFFWSGILTSVLLLDDFFLFHDDLAKRLFRMKQRHVEIAYVAAVAAYLVAFRRILLESDWPILFAALSLFGGSMAVDQLQHHFASHWRIAFEDGSKFLGIVVWAGYFVQTGLQAVRRGDGRAASEG